MHKDLSSFIDLDRYPLHQLDSELGQSLIAKCHRMMAEDTICVLPGFLRPVVTKDLAAEIDALESYARNINFLTTLYGWMDNSGFPEEHPRSRLFRRQCSVLTTDQLDDNGLCMQLFQFNQLTEFVRRLLNYETLYQSACPNISARLNIMSSGDQFPWHFDTNDGVVSFITQEADHGGIFEYAPLIRSEDDENYPGVARILNNDDQPKQAEAPPGSFILFLGRRSLHRVSKVGDTTKSRQSLLFSYDQKPGMVFPEKTRKRMTEPSSEPYLGALTPIDR